MRFLIRYVLFSYFRNFSEHFSEIQIVRKRWKTIHPNVIGLIPPQNAVSERAAKYSILGRTLKKNCGDFGNFFLMECPNFFTIFGILENYHWFFGMFKRWTSNELQKESKPQHSHSHWKHTPCSMPNYSKIELNLYQLLLNNKIADESHHWKNAQNSFAQHFGNNFYRFRCRFSNLLHFNA